MFSRLKQGIIRISLKNRFDSIFNFLESRHRIFSIEVLLHYPNWCELYLPPWLESLQSLNQDDLWKVDAGFDYSPIKGSSLYELFENIKELTFLPYTSNSLPPLTTDDYFNVTFKKKHEINSLYNPVVEMHKKHNFDQFIDIGGGVGHLSRVMSLALNIPAICIDNNIDLQSKGKKLLNNYKTTKDFNQVEFKHMTFGENVDELNSIFTRDSLSIGLHTCGNLALKHIDATIKHQSKALINFGCCYLKQNPKSEVNISSVAQQRPLNINKYALTLATRSHSELTLKSFQLKERVKYYRYGLHLLLMHEFGHTEFTGVGNAKPELYWQDFATYAKVQLSSINIAHKLSSKQLNAFFADDTVYKSIERMFLANIIRWKFGRVVEHYILLDRCLYLNEKGYKADLVVCFDEKLSPRNIGIFAFRKN